MGDAKLFQLSPSGATELPPTSFVIEKPLQTLIERNLEQFLGVRFLSSEFLVQGNPSGRIDTLGIDENLSPVIIEYKRSTNQNVINQGLFYLDWLMGHRADFRWLVLDKLRKETAEKIDWSGPRLLCIAGDFNKYDEHATKQMGRNIELIRYRKYGEQFLMLELVNSTHVDTGEPLPLAKSGATSTSTVKKSSEKTITEKLILSNIEVQNRYSVLQSFLNGLGEDVQFKATQNYFAFRRLKNFACVEVFPSLNRISLFLKVDPKSIPLEPGFSRDVSSIGHFGTGDLELLINSDYDLERAKPLIEQSYEAS